MICLLIKIFVSVAVGARLISHAGSLTNLAKYPASTIQILGAEKALFRALKTKGNTPKYGLIFHSTFIGRAAPKNKGRISRYLANKCSIAARIDCFTDAPSQIFGNKLREQVLYFIYLFIYCLLLEIFFFFFVV
jgi:RNA processing factor Prp31